MTIVMTVKDLAKRWNVSVSTIYRRLHGDDLPYYPVGERSFRIDGVEAELWLAARRHGAKPKRKWKL